MLLFVTLNGLEGTCEIVREVKGLKVFPYKGELVDKDGELLSTTGALTGGVMNIVEYLSSMVPVLKSNPDNKALVYDLESFLGREGKVVRILIDGENLICSSSYWGSLRLSLLERCNPEIVVWEQGVVKDFYKRVRAALG